MTEIWKPVPGLEGMYSVSNTGTVRSDERLVRFVDKLGVEQFRRKAPKTLALQKINSGYLVAHMSANGKIHAKTVHSMVAAAFIGPRPDGLDVCHNNGIKTDNRASNLRYDTRSNNHKDKVGHGTVYAGATAAKLTPDAVRVIRAMNDNNTLDWDAAAKAFGVTRESIRRVVRKESWKHVA